jgi:general secretion pathway protein K
LPPQRLEQLAWLGLEAPVRERLAPYASLLPVRTPVNLNTAPKEVLAAVLGVDLASAERLVQTRQRSPFKALDDARSLLPADTPLDERQVSVTSSFFEVQGRLRLDDRVIEERALVERRGRNVVTLHRERLPSPPSAVR